MGGSAEADVFSSLADWLDRRGYELFVHVPDTHQSIEEYARVYDRYPAHSVSIGPYKPDILGYTPSNRVFAIEVKGTENLRKGLGQAISYQRGADYAYLAADSAKLRRVHDLALSKGIGVFEVDPTERDVADKHPYSAEMKDLLYNTRHQLDAMYVTGNQRSRRLPNYTNPLNQLMPVIAIAGHDRTTDDAIGELAEETEYPYRSVFKRMIRFAEYLGMIRRENEAYRLTRQGEMGWTMLQGYGIDSVSDLKGLKTRRPLYVNHPPIATYLRNRFVSIPDFRTLFEVLLRYGNDSISIQTLCATLIDNYPSTFLNLVYSDTDDDRGVPNLIEQGRGDEIYENPEFLARIVHSQFISNTVSQLKNLGVLDETTTRIEPKSDLNPEEDHWYPRKFQLG